MLVERDVPLQKMASTLDLLIAGERQIATNKEQNGSYDGSGNRAGKSGQGSILLLSGEAGIGKTTCLQAFCESLDDRVILRWGGCDPLNTPRVLGPFFDMASSFGDEVQYALNTAESTATALSSCVLKELQSSSTPSVIVIEDAHWADNATLDLLKCLGRRISFINCLLIISYRSDEITKAHPLHEAIGDFPSTSVERISLQAISRKGVEQLANAAGREAGRLFEITAGNAFYVTEYLASDFSGQVKLPDSIQSAVGARVGRLEARYQNFLETLSVIPHTISEDLIYGLFSEEAAELTNFCVQRNFLKAEGQRSFRFRHELARLGTLARVPEYCQCEIHSSIFSLLDSASSTHSIDEIESTVSVEQRLFHADGAKLVRPVLELSQLAGRNAANAGSHVEAASHYATALEYVAHATDEEAASIYEHWSYEAALVAVTDETIAARQKALELWRKQGRADKIGENLQWLSRQHWYRGESELARRYIGEAISTLENTDPSVERAKAYSLNSQFHMLNNRMDEAIAFGRKALELEEQYPAAEVRIHALNNIGAAMAIRDNREGLELLQQSLKLALEHDQHEHAARAYTNMASATVYGLDYELAERMIADGIVFDTTHDLDSWTHYLFGIMAQLRMEQSRFEEAETIARGVMELPSQTLLMKLPSLLVLSRVSLRLGRPDAGELLNQALEDATKVNEVQYIGPARIALTEAAWMAGDEGKARAQLEALAAINTMPFSSWRGAEPGQWMHRYGLLKVEDKPARFPLPYQLEVDGKHCEAADKWLAKGSPFKAAICLIHTAKPQPVREFQKALQLLESCRAQGAIKKLRNLAEQKNIADALSPVKRGPRKQARQHPLGLTAKEQTILPLIIEGMSNREISETLSRSQRTVENHVASILKKMNVKSRLEVMLRGKNEPWLLLHEPVSNEAFNTLSLKPVSPKPVLPEYTPTHAAR